MQVQVQVNEVVESARNLDPVLVYPQRNTVLVQTDRQMYKPGDIVRIRLLALNEELLASSKYKVNTSNWYFNQIFLCTIFSFQISLIKIRNPRGATVAVWDNVQTTIGLAHLEYLLSEETVEGNWTIQADSKRKTFEVRRHTLPRFKVSVDHPKSVYVRAEDVPIRVCAK